MNGVTMFRPAFSVRWYRPNRSTMPADACGTMRTDLTTAAMTATASTTSRIVTIRELMAASLLRPGRVSQCLTGYPGLFATLPTASV
jgi:hypothetical protein